MAYAQAKFLQTWKIAAFLVAFFSSFFVFAQDVPTVDSSMLDLDDPQSPKLQSALIISCVASSPNLEVGTAVVDEFATIEDKRLACQPVVYDELFSRLSSYDFCESSNVRWTSSYQLSMDVKQGYKCLTNATLNQSFFAGAEELVESATCPPDNPDLFEYMYGQDNDGDGLIDSCYRLIDDSCPEGYYKLKIEIDGELQCKAVECDPAGDGKSIWAKGSVYSNNAGTYCDGFCAHTVEGSQNNEGYGGSISIFAVSTGESCGQIPSDESMHDGDGSDCVSVDVGTGTNFLSCPEGSDDNSDNPDDTPEEPPVDLDDEKADDDDLPDIPTNEESCAENDPSCEIRNLKEKLETENDEKKQQDNSLHNKNITAIEKSTNSIVNNITQASKDTANRNADGFKSVTDAVGKLADAIKDGTGSNGGGSGGDGDGSYITITQDIDKSAFESLFDESEIADLESDITKLQNDIKDFINQSKTEAQSLVTLSSMGASGYVARPLEIGGRSFNLSLSRFDYFFQALAGPFLFICAIIAAIIILRSND